MAKITVALPVATSPPANTPRLEVFIVWSSTGTMPFLPVPRSGVVWVPAASGDLHDAQFAFDLSDRIGATTDRTVLIHAVRWKPRCSTAIAESFAPSGREAVLPTSSAPGSQGRSVRAQTSFPTASPGVGDLSVRAGVWSIPHSRTRRSAVGEGLLSARPRLEYARFIAVLVASPSCKAAEEAESLGLVLPPRPDHQACHLQLSERRPQLQAHPQQAAASSCRRSGNADASV
jgi:hypothetical protein